MSRGPQRAHSWRVGRLQIGYRLYIHRSTATSPFGDRWVLQPDLIWDRPIKKVTS